MYSIGLLGDMLYWTWTMEDLLATEESTVVVYANHGVLLILMMYARRNVPCEGRVGRWR